MMNAGTPDVIPLQVSGSVDSDLTGIPTNKLMRWGIRNAWRDGQEGTYAIRHGSSPVMDFHPRGTPNDANVFVKAFPCLFPYGVGGVESLNDRGLEMGEHVRWALRYHDRRFRTHETFPFFAFGIIQRRQALTSARIQMQRKDFERNRDLLSSLTLNTLQRAAGDEEQNIPTSEPVVQSLRKHMFAASGRMQGSDSGRYQLRSQIWSTALMLQPPSLWITINPCDLHDPIVQILAGEHIDLDQASQVMLPDKERRAYNVARDPYAASKFFHYTIHMILEKLFGISASSTKVISDVGALGRVSGYFGTVESQGRGTLHLHMLLYLTGALSSAQMTDLLQTAEFRQRIIDFLKANLCADIPGIKSRDDLKHFPNEVEIAWSRPPTPVECNDTYFRDVTQMERRVARSKQVHTCEYRRCLVPDGTGRLKCKRRAPFEKSDEYAVEPDGRWRVRRVFGYFNTWIRSVSAHVRCNNDGKLLTNGGDTSNVSFYATTYQTKKQGKTYNVSAIMAKGYEYHQERERNAGYVDEVRDRQRLMLFRVVNAINREQELAAPMVIAYLMGWGDSIRSHHYSPVYWSSFVHQLLLAFPDLRATASRDEGTNVPSTSQVCDQTHLANLKKRFV